MGKVSNVVGKMPFAGRATVENAALSAISERTSLREKAGKAAGAAGFLAVFAGLHGLQAKMGAEDMRIDYAELMSDGVTPMEAVEAAISTSYTLANSAVTYTQMQIAGRVGSNYLKFRNHVRNGGQLAENDYDFTARRATLTEVAATLGGQVAFMTFRDKL